MIQAAQARASPRSSCKSQLYNWADMTAAADRAAHMCEHIDAACLQELKRARVRMCHMRLPQAATCYTQGANTPAQGVRVAHVAI
jgi:hypothetical protein